MDTFPEMITHSIPIGKCFFSSILLQRMVMSDSKSEYPSEQKVGKLPTFTFFMFPPESLDRRAFPIEIVVNKVFTIYNMRLNACDAINWV